jgi:hypothetical protein
MTMQDFEFVATVGSTTTVLDLLTGGTWKIGSLLNLGTVDVERSWLTQFPFDGGELSSSRLEVTEMVIPIRLTKQANWAACQTAITALCTELNKATNVLRMQLGSTNYYFNTYRAAIPTLLNGGLPMDVSDKLETQLFDLIIPRDPIIRNSSNAQVFI